MTFTLTSHGTTLGQTGAELTGLQPGARGWHFLPAPAFETVRPLLIELQTATLGLQELMPTVETLATIRESEREAFVRHAIMSDPGAARFLELMDAVDALALELHDAAGAPVPARTLGVTELELTPEAFREVLRAIDPNADPRLSATPPFYLLVAGV
jgi:hypothetical protein